MKSKPAPAGKKQPKRANIHDVAKAARCSIATVSLVLNHSGRIGQETRARVMETITRLGYQPNTAGRNLRLQRTDTIGLMFDPAPSKIFKNIFYVEVMEGLEETLSRSNLSLLLGSGRDELALGNLPNFMRRGSVDALVLMGQFPESNLQVLLRTRTPVLLLDSFHEHLNLDCITSDGRNGARQAMDLLVSLGHKRVAMLAYDSADYNIAARIGGFVDSVKHHGLDERLNPVIRAFTVNEQVPDIIALLLAMPADRRPTALICINDNLAVYAADHLTGRGVSVPGEMSIVGFDDDSIARTHSPALTTVRIDSRKLGQMGAEMILQRLQNPKAPWNRIILPTQLVERASTAAPDRKSRPA